MRLAQLQMDIDSICSAPTAIDAVLVDIHNSINAIGGIPSNDYERGMNDAVGRALAIVEAKQLEVSHGA